MASLRNPRGTRAALNALAAGNLLLSGQVYLITDEARLAIATGVNTYEAYAKQSEAGGGGGAPVFTATLEVAGMAPGYAEVVLAAPAVTPASKVNAWLVGELDAENDLEELSDTNLRVFALAEAGQLRFVLTGNGPFTGPFKTNYQVNT